MKPAHVVDLRGTSGAGKTTAVRAYMQRIGIASKFSRENGKRPGGYILKNNVAVLGSYESVCGGCDTIPDMALVRSMLAQRAKVGPVLLEGLMVSGIQGGFTDIARELGRERYVFAFLDTPLDVCLKRVEKRRWERGDLRPFNPENTMARWQSLQKIKVKLKAGGFRVEEVPYGDAEAFIASAFDFRRLIETGD